MSAGRVVSPTVGHAGHVAGVSIGGQVAAGSLDGGGGGGALVAAGTPAPRISSCLIAKNAAAGWSAGTMCPAESTEIHVRRSCLNASRIIVVGVQTRMCVSSECKHKRCGTRYIRTKMQKYDRHSIGKFSQPHHCVKITVVDGRSWI